MGETYMMANRMGEAPIQLVRRTLAQVGFFDVMRTYRTAMGSVLPTADDSYLSLDNPRLMELMERYRPWARAFGHSQWTADYVAAEIDLKRFRADSAIMWQHRDGNMPPAYLATYFFLKQSFYDDDLQACAEDDKFGVFALKIGDEYLTRDRLDSVLQIGFMKELLGLSRRSSVCVLDIGSGYGRLGVRLTQLLPCSHTLCVDGVPETAFICEFYLRYRGVDKNARMLELPALRETMRPGEVDVAFAVNSLSECSAVAVSWWAETLREARVPYLVIIPDNSASADGEIYTIEQSDRRRVPISSILKRVGYRRRVVRPKYPVEALQRYGVSPTNFHLFELRG